MNVAIVHLTQICGHDQEYAWNREILPEIEDFSRMLNGALDKLCIPCWATVSPNMFRSDMVGYEARTKR